MGIRNITLTVLGLVLGCATLRATTPEWASKADHYRWEDGASYPSFIRFKNGEGPGFADLYTFLREALSLGTDDQLRLVRTEEDRLGYLHLVFQQFHHDHPVLGGTYKAHLKGSKAVTVNGRIFRIAQPLVAPIPESEALRLALGHVGASTYKWEVPGETEALRYAKRDPNATYFPTGVLTYAPNKGTASTEAVRLAYRFDIYAHTPMSKADIYVDAVTGEVIFRNETLHTIDKIGSAVTHYSGTQTMVADSAAGMFTLREAGRANGVETYNMQFQSNYAAAVDFTDLDNFWNNVNANYEHAGPDAHWGAEMTHDYFFNLHGRSSFDGQGSVLLSYVHFDNNYSNAFWDGTRMTYGGGGNNSRPFCALDVVGHEFSHGVTGTSAGLIYQNESGALNESFSDIFGAAIEFYSRPGNANWKIGEDLGGIRDMANPANFNNPDTYFGSFWYAGSFDNGGVHTNSGVQNFWFYLLSEGGNGNNDNGDAYSVSALGIDTAAMIAFRNLTVYLTEFDTYADARYYAIESAIDLFGPCSNEMVQTINAWYAVGVGNPYTGTLEAAYFTPDTNNCRLPANVQFYNNSLSAIQYHWDFGDGTTSTAVNPMKTYFQAGTYTVTLVAIGCNGQADTMTIANRIVVDLNQPCTINLPGSGVVNQTGCSGELYDSGGASNYLDNSYGTATIDVGTGNIVTLTFLSFNYAPGDRVKIFDGPDANAPLLGTFSGTVSPGTIVASGSTLTVQESTNGASNREGFHATWSCAVGNSPALAEGLKIWPNPSNGQFRVEWAGLAPGAIEYRILDAMGREVLRGHQLAQGTFQAEFALRNAAKGMYFIELRTGEMRRTAQLRVD